MNRSGYESDSSGTSSENLLEIILDEEEEMRRQRKKKFHAALLLANFTLCVGLEEGNDRTYRERLKWDEHVSLLNKEGPNAFYAMYRMHYPSYMKLCKLIDNFVRKNEEMANRGTGKSVGFITTPIALHCCIRWLSGGSFHDIRLTAGMSKTSFYMYAYRCIRAINESEALSYKFPTSPQEVEEAAQSFKAISSNGVIEGCVAAIDGILIKTITPSRKEVAAAATATATATDVAAVVDIVGMNWTK